MKFTVTESTNNQDGTPRNTTIYSGTYAARPGTHLESLDYTQAVLNPSGSIRKLIADEHVAFNGVSTYRLARMRKVKSELSGWVLPGYWDSKFPLRRYIPHDQVWRFGSKHDIGKFLETDTTNVTVEEGAGQIEGVNVLRVTAALDGVTYTLWVAPERNYLPLKTLITHDDTGQILERKMLSQLIQLENGLWYPQQVLYDWGEGSPVGRLFEFQEVSSSPLPDTAFKIVFLAGTRVVDQTVGISYWAGEGADSGLEKLDLETEGQLDDLVAQAQVQHSSALSELTPDIRNTGFDPATTLGVDDKVAGKKKKL